MTSAAPTTITRTLARPRDHNELPVSTMTHTLLEKFGEKFGTPAAVFAAASCPVCFPKIALVGASVWLPVELRRCASCAAGEPQAKADALGTTAR